MAGNAVNETDRTAEVILDDTEDRFSVVENCPVALDEELKIEATESGDSTIQRMLSAYQIGQKIRHLRLRKKFALMDLGRHTGLSASMLSQLENGKLIPTLATLARIAMVFDVGLEYFFGDRKSKRRFVLVRADERLRFLDRPTSPKPDFYFECLAFAAQEKSLQAYLAEFPHRSPREVSEHVHDGAEFIHLLEGSLVVRHGADDHVLHTGDSAYFDSSEPHSYCGASKQPAKAIVVTTMPRL
jgi:transcriptional regulator with XRE-family HTH domain